MCDQEIVEEILAGNQAAMRVLINRYQDLVINSCFRVLHNAADAEDIAQEVFIEAYRSISSLQNGEKLSFWLYRMALNKSINFQKKNRLLKKVLFLDHIAPGKDCKHMPRILCPEADPHQAMVREERMHIFKDALSGLPARQQKAFILHHFEDLSYKEIADVLKVSLSCVESLIFRAKSNLKKKCRRYSDDFF